ncbi:probable monosaccharide transporter [Rhynchosporium graminicola]|uniref:Quinate transporter n=1 Tax=Rhynchosporium graminicola TaxID=2792576 RepID=A0A1E1L407_9HELO|nr:probable monosaccharide transporter [Rhynchosporium commune]
MGMFSANDQSAFKAPDAVYNWRVYALAVSAAMGSTRFGLATAKGDELASLKANIVSTFQAGCFFGAILCYWMNEKLGRRIPLMICGSVFNVGVIMQMASNGTIGLIYAGRAFTGLGVGASSLIIPQYISECSPPAIRGRLIGVFEILLQFSLVIGFWVNYGVNENVSPTSDKQWHIPFAIQFVPGTLLIIAMYFQPESPRWLLKNNRDEEAIKSLTYIRQLPADDAYLQWEVETCKEQIQLEFDSGANASFVRKLKAVFAPGVRNRVAIGMALMMLQNLSGINALNYYSPTIFASIGFTGTSTGLLATGVFGLVKAFATLGFMIWGIDKLGRRKSLLIGSIGAIIAMFYLAGFSNLSGSFGGTAKQDAGAYVAIVMIYLFAIFYAMSWNGIPWIFCAEVFPTGTRSLCLVFTTCTQWLGQFIIVYSTPYMMENVKYGTFIFFGSSLVVGIIFVILFMPETKGLSLEDMDIMFNLAGLAHSMRAKTDAIIAERRIADDMDRSGIKNDTHMVGNVEKTV